MRKPNAVFADDAAVFRRACSIAKIPPTKRQASKWRNQKGLAYAFKNEAIAQLSEEAHR